MKPATWILALTIVLSLGTAAEARGVVIINTGDDIIELRALHPDDVRDTGFTKLGYHYSRLGVFWLDLWRWGGEFVAYDSTRYAPLTAEELARLGGAKFPWAYRLPPGLVVIVSVFAFGMVSGMRRSRLTLAIGLALLGVGALFYAKGLTWQVAVPTALAAFAITSSWRSLREPDFDSVDDSA